MEEENVETTQGEISIDTWTNSITDNAVVSYGLKIGIGIAVFIILMILSKVVTRVVRKNIKKHLEETNPTGAGKIAKLLGSILFWVLMLFALFICFEIMGINIGLLISGVSLGVGLAFKEVLGNMFAGIMILYTKEFKMGDIIEIQSGDGYFGRIEEITIRYTVIRTLDLRQVVIPNMTMISEPIKTFSSEDLVKLNTIIGISYGSDVTKAIQVLKDTINSFDFVKAKENTTVYVLEFGASTINLKCIFCFDPKCGIIGEVAIGQINERVPKAFEENGIEFSYDHIVLNFEDTNKETNEKIQTLLNNEEKRNNKELIVNDTEDYASNSAEASEKQVEQPVEEPVEQYVKEASIEEPLEQHMEESLIEESVEQPIEEAPVEEVPAEEINNRETSTEEYPIEENKNEIEESIEQENNSEESKHIRDYANEQVIPETTDINEPSVNSNEVQSIDDNNVSDNPIANNAGDNENGGTENVTNSFYSKYSN